MTNFDTVIYHDNCAGHKNAAGFTVDKLLPLTF